jgi:hypothetical protein
MLVVGNVPVPEFCSTPISPVPDCLYASATTMSSILSPLTSVVNPFALDSVAMAMGLAAFDDVPAAYTVAVPQFPGVVLTPAG